LANSLGEELNRQQIKKIIMDLYKYTREHFSTEEKMMKEAGYPKLEKHRDLHEELITELNEVCNQTFDDEESVFIFKKFIFDWLIKHILNQDKDYFIFVNAQLLNKDNH